MGLGVSSKSAKQSAASRKAKPDKNPGKATIEKGKHSKQFNQLQHTYP